MRTLLRSVVLVVACALLAAGCGGEERAAAPTLPSSLAERLAARSDAVAASLDRGDACAARAGAEALQAVAIAAVNEKRVPGALQEELLGSVAALVESIPCEPAPPPGEADEEDEEDEDEEEEGHGKGRGKAKGKGKD